MGLAGRKIKQRIGVDPRNLTWSDDSSKFGVKYLQSLGWTSGSGLGVSGEGRTTNLKIHQKLDLMGIGANREGSDDSGGKIGRQLDSLLARLNQAQSAHTLAVHEPGDEGSADGGGEPKMETHKAGQDVHPEAVGNVKPVKRQEKKDKTNKKGKRKRSTEEHEDDDKVEKRRRKEQKRAETEKKERHLNHEVEKCSTGEMQVAGPSASPIAQTAKVAPRYRAHRARNIASNRLVVASTTGMKEILGIAASSLPEQTHDPPSMPFPALSKSMQQNPRTDHDKMDQFSAIGLGAGSSLGSGFGFETSKAANGPKPSAASGDNLLQKSTKSVAEYFAEKMRMKNVPKEAMDLVEYDSSKDERRRRKKRKERE